MLKLVIKDFRANRTYLLLLFIVLAAISFGFNLAIIAESEVEAELFPLVVILSAMVASKLFILAEAEVSADKLFAGFPVTRKEMVLAKYISSGLLILMALSIHLLVIRISSTEALRSENSFIYQPEMWIISGLILIISDAFSFPFYFRYGIAKGAMMYGVVLITFMMLTVLVLNMLNPGDLLHALFLRVTDQPAWAIFAELVALFLLILSSSILISISVFKTKDL
ncbi:ABC-2 transporter permease [Ekhidna sp.]